MPAHPAVAVHDDFAPGQPRVALRPAHHKPPGRVDEIGRLPVEQVRRQHLLHHFLDDETLDGPVLHVGGVLRGHHDVGDARRLAVDILHRDLALGVRAQPFDRAGLANAGQFAPQLMGEHDRRRHQFGGFLRGVAKHQALVARPLLGGPFSFGGAGIHALRNVRALRRDRVQNHHPVRVENVIRMRIANVANGLAGDGVEVQPGPGGDFSAHHHQVALGVSLAGHPAARVLGQAGVQHRIRNRVAHLVRMAFADGFRGKNVILAHSIKRYPQVFNSY